MLPTYVILKGVYGEPLKRVFMAVEDTEIIIGDPERLREIKSGDQPVDFVSQERVFNFEEEVYIQLLIEWQTAKGTSPDLWQRLGRVELKNELSEYSCQRECQG
jgi:hypothetical protein